MIIGCGELQRQFTYFQRSDGALFVPQLMNGQVAFPHEQWGLYLKEVLHIINSCEFALSRTSIWVSQNPPLKPTWQEQIELWHCPFRQLLLEHLGKYWHLSP